MIITATPYLEFLQSIPRNRSERRRPAGGRRQPDRNLMITRLKCGNTPQRLVSRIVPSNRVGCQILTGGGSSEPPLYRSRFTCCLTRSPIPTSSTTPPKSSRTRQARHSGRLDVAMPGKRLIDDPKSIPANRRRTRQTGTTPRPQDANAACLVSNGESYWHAPRTRFSVAFRAVAYSVHNFFVIGRPTYASRQAMRVCFAVDAVIFDG